MLNSQKYPFFIRFLALWTALGLIILAGKEYLEAKINFKHSGGGAVVVNNGGACWHLPIYNHRPPPSSSAPVSVEQIRTMVIIVLIILITSHIHNHNHLHRFSVRTQQTHL